MSDYKPNSAEIKELRAKTLAGFQDCQRALAEAKGDMTTAEEIIRKKGLQVAARKAHREACEGLIAAKVDEGLASGAIVEVNTETDFAARNEEFRKLTCALVDHVLGVGPDEITEGSELHEDTLHPHGGRTVKSVIDETIGKIGENMGLRRAVRFKAVSPGIVTSYIHPPGKIGVLLELGYEKGADKDKAAELAHELALQIAFADPSYVVPEDIPETVLAKEREIAHEKAREQGKPEHLVPKIAEGMLRKFYADECLLDQPYAKDPKSPVRDFIKRFGVPGATVRRFVRFALK